MRQATVSIAKLGPAAVVAAKAIAATAAAALAIKGVKLAAELESTSVAFETMLGSASKATEVMKNLKKLGAENVYVRQAKPYQPPPPKPDTTNEPGSVLYRVLRDVFEVKPKPGCGCHRLRDEMDALGVEGCEREASRLVDRLKENAKAYRWLESFGAALNAVRNGALGLLDPFRPWESILKHAIETSRELKAVTDAGKEIDQTHEGSSQG